MFICYSSDKLEKLAEKAAEFIAQAPLSPFDKETVIVQTDGMYRWLSMELAKHNGVFASAEFVKPDKLVDICEKIIDKGNAQADETIFDKELSLWTNLNVIDELRDDILASYIRQSEPQNELRRFQIADGAADLFDQYAIYRQDMLAEWEKENGKTLTNSPHEEWQRKLWLALNKKYASIENRYRRLAKLREDIGKTVKPLNSDAPKRIICFGISLLPDYYIDLLGKLSEITDIHFFYITPCRYYWGDIVSRKYKAIIEKKMNQRMIKTGRQDDKDEDLFHYEVGNELLSAFGKLGRDFLYALYNTDLNFSEGDFLSDDSTPKTLLQSIQADIRNMNDRTNADEGKKYPLFDNFSFDENDSSIRFASCHSPMRETEALLDYLLGLFNDTAELLPKDIVVMCSDIGLYAPYIDAVFGTVLDDKIKMKKLYSIADRPITKTGGIVPVFLRLLDLLESRFEASSVVALFESPAIRSKFNLTSDDCETVIEWIKDANIRWGIDSDFLEALDIPEYDAYDANTWQAGIDRMLSAYAILPEDNMLYNGSITPYKELQGGESQLLGCIAIFFRRLSLAARTAEKSKSPADWQIFFDELLETFFVNNGDSYFDLKLIRNQLNVLAEAKEICGFDKPLSFNTIKMFLQKRLDSVSNESNFLAGGLTFCSMKPLRSIPFKVICLLGMNDGAFPRRQPELPFDLMLANPRRGDRNVREGDKYLFLETIMSAREKLYVSYVGKNIKDNTDLLPSSAVIALKDYIDKAYSTETEKEPSKKLTVEHPLQGFSPKYFDGKNEMLFSFRKDNLAAAQTTQTEKTADYSSSAQVPSELNDVGLNELINFLKNTCKFFLKNKLNVDLDIDESPVADEESFQLKGLGAFNMKTDMLNRMFVNGEYFDEEKLKAEYKNAGLLPPGTVGNIVFNEQISSMRDMKQRIEKYICDDSGRPLSEEIQELEIELNGKRILTGQMKLYGAGIDKKNVIYGSFGKDDVKAKDRLVLWIHHLAACAAGFLCHSHFIGEREGTELSLKPVSKENAVNRLSEIVALYNEGGRRAVEFFPETSWAYYMDTATDKKDSLPDYDEQWESDRIYDVYLQKCYPEDKYSKLPSKTQNNLEEYAQTVFNGFNEAEDKK